MHRCGNRYIQQQWTTTTHYVLYTDHCEMNIRGCYIRIDTSSARVHGSTRYAGINIVWLM